MKIGEAAKLIASDELFVSQQYALVAVYATALRNKVRGLLGREPTDSEFALATDFLEERLKVVNIERSAS